MDNASIIPHDELVGFYNMVEETIINLFGGYDKAAAYFDLRGGLDGLWNFSSKHYVDGWHASRVARTWFDENVRPGDRGDVPLPVTPAYTTPSDSKKFDLQLCDYDYTGYTTYGYEPEIEPEILAARKSREKRWKRLSCAN